MTPRIDSEVSLIKARYSDVIYDRDKGWILLENYGAFEGWLPNPISVAFQINPSHPGATPYGFYVPSNARHRGVEPKNFTARPKVIVPFDGDWGFFSWSPRTWAPAADIHAGSNLLNWALSFASRLREGA